MPHISSLSVSLFIFFLFSLCAPSVSFRATPYNRALILSVPSLILVSQIISYSTALNSLSR
ncbi:hypothetical protein F5H01DRAFT_338180 [Linnemannia elongata]|nr:hypothetical protein F5H01DRAFT_338180 [Linnemannia elongata]